MIFMNDLAVLGLAEMSMLFTLISVKNSEPSCLAELFIAKAYLPFWVCHCQVIPDRSTKMYNFT